MAVQKGAFRFVIFRVSSWIAFGGQKSIDEITRTRPKQSEVN